MPAWRAKAASDLNRATPAVSPTIMAAVRAPTPGRASRAGADRAARALMRRSRSLTRRVKSMTSGQFVAGELGHDPGQALQPPGEDLLVLGQVQRPRPSAAQDGSSSWTRHSSRFTVAVRGAGPGLRAGPRAASAPGRPRRGRRPAGRAPASAARATAAASIGSDLPRVRAILRSGHRRESAGGHPGAPCCSKPPAPSRAGGPGHR